MSIILNLLVEFKNTKSALMPFYLISIKALIQANHQQKYQYLKKDLKFRKNDAPDSTFNHSPIIHRGLRLNPRDQFEIEKTQTPVVLYIQILQSANSIPPFAIPKLGTVQLGLLNFV